MSYPNIILRGCIKADDAIKFVKTLLKEDWTNDKRDEDVNLQSSRQARVVRWGWGVQINCHPYRSMNTIWWDELLKIFSSSHKWEGERRFIIIMHNIDTLDSDIQKCLRRHAEDDHKTIRYIFTCSADCILEPSLESRSICLVRRESHTPMLPKMTEWQDVLNLWLSDIPVQRIMDKIFIDAIEEFSLKTGNKEDETIKIMVFKWCQYSDMLKYCYHELTILESGWKWLYNLLRNDIYSE
jgi:DNA polymerase III delta prime subunit